MVHSGKRSRDKGKEGERLARDFLRQYGWMDARRGQQYSGIDGQDIVSPALSCIHFEVKYGYGKVDVGAGCILEWLAQAEGDASIGQTAVVLWKPHRARQWRLTLRFEGFVVTLACDDDIVRMLSRLQSTSQNPQNPQ